MGFGDFLGSNSVSVDASKEETSVRSKYPQLLHERERIEIAFKDRGGAGRDKSYFTTHRVLLKDGKGIGGKRKNYLSIPYASLQAFAIETAGGGFDGDGELKLWSKGCGALRTIDFAKGSVDMFGIQQFLNSKVPWKIHPADEEEDPVQGQPTKINQAQPLASFMHWLGDNAHQLNPTDVEQHLKVQAPVLCSNETVGLAFKTGRDSLIFTDRRLLIVDVKGLRGKRVQFWSVPWTSVHAFAVKTVGAFLDGDTELVLYTNILSYPEIKQDFRNSHADLFAIQKFISNKVLGGEDTTEIANIPKLQGQVDSKGSWWFRENQRPLDATEMDRFYHSAAAPILQTNERVEMAFKGRRDVTLFTTRRVIDIDSTGLTGKSVIYKSLPWKSIVGFAVRTAGTFDTDAEMFLYTELMFDQPESVDEPAQPGESVWQTDFHKKSVNVLAVKKYLAERVLRAAKGVAIAIPADLYDIGAKEQGFSKFLSKIGNDSQKIDPTELDAVLHSTNPILLDNENIVMAFKSGRDIHSFTNLRILKMDVQGLTGAKIEYTSIPYSSIRAFSAESAGGWDLDSELDIYTRNLWTMAKVSLDFRKGKADIIVLQKFLSSVLFGTKQDVANYFTSKQPISMPVNTAKVDSFLSFLTGHSVSVDAQEADHQLHAEPSVLLDDERVDAAFMEGRDMYVYTNKRLLIVDVQGLRGKKVEYKSIPLEQWCDYEIETAGHLDRDAEAFIHCDIATFRRTKHSILVKTYDIYRMNLFLTTRLLFSEPEIAVSF